jgi:hypothetical protein
MSVAVTKSYSYLMDPTYRKIFFNGYAAQPSFFDKVFNVSTVNKGNWIAEAMLSPLGPARTIAEGNPVEFDFPVQGNAVKKYFQKYGLGFQVTEEMQDDDLQGLISQVPAELGTSLAYSRELTAWDLFNNGMTASLYTAMDGKAYFINTHSLLKSGIVGANAPSAGGALSDTTLQAALDTIALWTDEAGRYKLFTPKYLVVPSGTTADAVGRILLKTEYKYGSPNNDINPIPDKYPGLQLLEVPFLTSTTAWFIVCDQRDIRFVWRRQAKFQSGDDFSTGNSLFKSTARWVVYGYDWRGVYRNAGV